MRYVLIMAWFFSELAIAATLDDRLAEFEKTNYLRDQFREERVAYYLDKPIVTEGELEYRAPAVLIKKIVSPEKIKQTIKNNILTITTEKNKKTIDLSEQPELAIGIYALIDLLEGDKAGLEKRFLITYQDDQENKNTWEMKLKPKDEKVFEDIKQILIKGLGGRLKLFRIDY